MFGIRRYSAASPDVARLDFTVGYHWFMNNVWTFAAGASFMTVPRDSYGIRVGAAHDAGIDYDGTDMHINPKYVGSGKLWVGTDSTQADIWFNQCRSTGGLVEIYAAAEGSCALNFVEGANTAVRWKAQYSMDAFHLGMGSLTGRQLVFVNAASIDEDYGHAVSTDPIIYIHSATAIASSTAQWIGFSHNQTDGTIATGAGNIDLNPAGEVRFNSTTKAEFNDSGTYINSPANSIMAYVADGAHRFDGGMEWDTATVTGATTLGAHHVLLVDTDTAGAAVTVTLPAVSGLTGRVYYVKNTGTSGYDVTLDGDGAETVDGDATQTITDGECLLVVCDGTEWWIV
jgi:hypothetical protein